MAITRERIKFLLQHYSPSKAAGDDGPSRVLCDDINGLIEEIERLRIKVSDLREDAERARTETRDLQRYVLDLARARDYLNERLSQSNQQIVAQSKFIIRLEKENFKLRNQEAKQ